MDHSVTFARHFTRLVWLLLHDPSNIDEQKGALRALATMSKDGAVTLTERDNLLTANEEPVSAAFAGAPEVAVQMGRHGLRAIQIEANAGVAAVLGVARILASAPPSADHDPGTAAEARLAALGATTVSFKLRPQAGALPDLELGEVVETLAPPRASRAETHAAIEAAETPRSDTGATTGGRLFDQFAGPRTPSESAREVLAQLDATSDVPPLTALLEDIALLAEEATREGKGEVVSDIMYRLGRREAQLEDADAKRAVSATLQRLSKPVSLRLVATQLPHSPDRREELLAVLLRAGEDGAEAVVEQLALMAVQSDRHAYFEALHVLKGGVTALLRLLSDPRWFVVRNAVDLLGELQAPKAEQRLTTLLRHPEDRVRRAASVALMRLGTPKAMESIREALKSDAPEARMQGASAIAALRDVRLTGRLVRALDEEKNEEVQAAFLFTLGKLGGTDAVKRLLEAVTVERGLFKKKSTAYRMAAVQGLAEAKTPEALAALRELREDKDEDIREAANFALGRVARAARDGREGPAAAERPVKKPVKR